jgi:hypothetical protein
MVRFGQEGATRRTWVPIAIRTEELGFDRKYNGHIFKDRAGLYFPHLFPVLELKMP